MAHILFRRLVTATPDSTLSPYVALNEFWDTKQRTIYREQAASAVDDPSEVPLDTELARYAVRPGVARVVRYAGNGDVYTDDEGVTGAPSGGGACTLDAPSISPNPAATSPSGGATLTVECIGGVQPYQVVLRVQQQAAIVATATSASTLQPAQFTNVGIGRYQVTITDAVGCVRTGLVDVFAGIGQTPGVTLRDTAGYTFGRNRIFWNPVTKAVESEYTDPPYGSPTDPDFDNYTPYGTPVDGYLLADGYTWRAVYSDGTGGVYFTDSDTRKPGLLELHNFILFHPDRPQDATGGVLVECTATDYPLSFQLGDGTGTTFGPPNSTGHFDGLTADSYEVVVSDAEGRTLRVPFALRARYGKRWELVADSLDATPWAVEIWKLGYREGVVEPLCGQETPFELRSDGLNSSLGGQGDIPAAIGTSLELRLLATLEQLEEIQLAEDRGYRVDYYRSGVLEFRGYVTPDVYSADLLDGLVPVSLTAADGLAGLKDTSFTGHVGQALTGRWPLLNTLLHCLSRCDVALPVVVATNRRPAELPTTVAPEAGVLTERGGYVDDKGEPLDMRAVVEAVAQTLGGTLVQRGGRWEIRAALEAAALSTPTRRYQAAGTLSAAPLLLAPADTVRPPEVVRLAGAGWHWLNDPQQRLSIRAGWKSLIAKTDLFYATNALPAGNVFGNDTAWNTSLDALLPTAGWSENAAAPGFPLVLEQAGDKNTDQGAKWPRATGPDARYLQSGTLPNRPDPEGVPWTLSVVGRLVIPGPDGTTVILPPTPGVGRTATITIELVVDGQRPLTPFYAVFPLPDDAKAGDTTCTFDLGPLPAQSRVARLRLSAWDGTVPPEAVLLIKQVVVLVKPQGVTWEGKDTFRADSNQGTVRPTEALSVFHADVPLKAGLFEGAGYAFRRATTVAGGALTTVWARPGDLAPAPLLESAALDGLALRAAPSRLLTGTLRYHHTTPPRMLDAVDAPYDLDGRRFLVAAVRDNPRAAECEVSLVEIGAGASLGTPDPLAGLPAGVRLLDGVEFAPGVPVLPGRGRPRFRATHHGVRIVG